MNASRSKFPFNAREDWIRETQIFQRIAGVPESSDEILGAEWDSWKTLARQAAEERKS